MSLATPCQTNKWHVTVEVLVLASSHLQSSVMIHVMPLTFSSAAICVEHDI